MIQSQNYYSNPLYLVPVNEYLSSYQQHNFDNQNFRNINYDENQFKNKNSETAEKVSCQHQLNLIPISQFDNIQNRPSQLSIPSNVPSCMFQKDPYIHSNSPSTTETTDMRSRSNSKFDYFRIVTGPDPHQVKDWYITPTNVLELNYEPKNSDIIAVYLSCDSSMGLCDPEIFLCAKSPKFTSVSNQIHLSNLKIGRGMIQGPTKGYKFRLVYILLSDGKEAWRVKSEPFHLWSSGGYPSNLRLYEKQQEHIRSLTLGNSFNDERESPRRKRTKSYD